MALEPVETCPIVSPRLLSVLTALREMLVDGSLPATVREVEAFADDADAAVTLTLTFAKFPREMKVVYDALRGRIPEIVSALYQDQNQERMELLGAGSLDYRVGDLRYRVSHLSFFQVNRFLAGEMAGAVVEAAGEGKLALDLFAGVGLFSLPLAKRFRRVIAVEANPVATRDFLANVALPENGCGGGGKLESREADAVEFLRRFRETPDCVVLDPPRAGLEAEGTSRLVKVQPARIVYVSCDPATMARDLAGLVAGGYRISVVHLFDLFPQTFHIESMVCLERRE
jgi:23S rRNA (uracil1939-C5)-methyltransferase